MVAQLDRHPDAASCACRMLQKDRAHINAAGLMLHADGTAGTIGDGDSDGPPYDREVELFGPSGGAALWRRAALDRLGLFDEDYFAYYEDADLAFRARAAGWRCVYAPDSRVVHLEGRTPSLARFDKVAYRLRNATWFVWTNLPARTLRRGLLRFAWSTGWRPLLKYGPRPWKVEGRSFWKAMAMLHLHPLKLWRKRAWRQRGHTVPPAELERWLGHNPFAVSTHPGGAEGQ
jgi:GT2 family glycosyltransferase